jgi:surface antigen
MFDKRPEDFPHGSREWLEAVKAETAEKYRLQAISGGGGSSDGGGSAGNVVGAAIVIALIVGAIWLFSGRHDDSTDTVSSPAADAAPSATTQTAQAAPTSPNDQPADTTGTMSPSVASAPDANRPATPQENAAGGNPGDAVASSDDLSGAPPPEFTSAITSALDQGVTTAWRSERYDLSGYVSVSAEQSYGDHTCRNLTYSFIRDNKVIAERQGQSCRGQDGVWRPAS